MSIFTTPSQLHISAPRSKLHDDTPAVQLLDLNDDVLLEICSTLLQLDRADKAAISPDDEPPKSMLLSFCSTCRYLRTLGGPLALRKPGTLTDCKDGLGRLPSLDPWLKSVGASPWFPRFMQALSIKVFVLMERDAVRLGSLVRNIMALKELRIITPQSRENTQANLRAAFASCSYPSLRNLTVSAGLEDLIPQLGTYEVLEIRDESPYCRTAGDTLQVFASQGFLQTVTQLWLGETPAWSPSLLRTLSEHLPALRELGTIKGGRPGFSYEGLLSQGKTEMFPVLEQVTMSPVNELGMRFYRSYCALKECGSSTRFCEPHTQSAVDYAGRLAFSTFPRLKTLQFQKTGRLTYKRDSAGDIFGMYADDSYDETVATGRLHGTRNADGSVGELSAERGDYEAIDGDTIYSHFQMGRHQ